jgi:hypothetical protein
MNAIDYTHLGKAELRQHAKAAGIKYGKMSLLQIREALAKVDTATLVVGKPAKKAGPSGRKNPSKPERKERTGTKMEKALAIVQDNRDLPRKAIIKLFMEKAKLTKAGSATYYSLVQKKLNK